MQMGQSPFGPGPCEDGESVWPRGIWSFSALRSTAPGPNSDSWDLGIRNRWSRASFWLGAEEEAPGRVQEYLTGVAERWRRSPPSSPPRGP